MTDQEFKEAMDGLRLMLTSIQGQISDLHAKVVAFEEKTHAQNLGLDVELRSIKRRLHTIEHFVIPQAPTPTWKKD